MKRIKRLKLKKKKTEDTSITPVLLFLHMAQTHMTPLSLFPAPSKPLAPGFQYLIDNFMGAYHQNSSNTVTYPYVCNELWQMHDTE